VTNPAVDWFVRLTNNRLIVANVPRHASLSCWQTKIDEFAFKPDQIGCDLSKVRSDLSKVRVDLSKVRPKLNKVFGDLD